MRLIEKIEAIKESCKDGRVLHTEILSPRKQDLSPLQRAVDFFILNRISFSGLLDCGGYSQKAYESRFTQSSIERLRAMPQILQNFHFSSDDYEVLLQKKGKACLYFLIRLILVRLNQSFMAKRVIYTQALITKGFVRISKIQHINFC
ncbi:Uncharacterised protein [Helicobacter cinaedi]|uniref:Uncharacterized protein n=1 Tax=Helicobacter cinaedi TaxID=213 RepID=A0A377JVU1_9HELI|nr:hypothetical protein [Helicobacter cinaedi]STP11385.1 Uncharacterised protein [Helicobacter cinaedi]